MTSRGHIDCSSSSVDVIRLWEEIIDQGRARNVFFFYGQNSRSCVIFALNGIRG